MMFQKFLTSYIFGIVCLRILSFWGDQAGAVNDTWCKLEMVKHSKFTLLVSKELILPTF